MPDHRLLTPADVAEDLGLPYPWIMRNDITVQGKWMHPPEAVRVMVGLVRAGLVRLAEYAVTEFALTRVNEAVAHASANGSPFRVTLLRPGVATRDSV